MVARYLVIVMGLPGTGKTTFARALAKKINAQHLNSDKVRSQLGRRGLYDPQAKEAIYNELLNRAEQALSEDCHVVVDATFSQAKWREAFHIMSEENGFSIRWIMMEADEAVIKDRVSQMRKYSEADFSVFQIIKKTFDPLQFDHLALRSDVQSIEEMVTKAIAFIRIPSEELKS